MLHLYGLFAALYGTFLFEVNTSKLILFRGNFLRMQRT